MLAYVKKSLKSINGFVVLEFLIVAAALATVATVFYTPSNTMLKMQAPLQVRVAAKNLAADIRAFQQSVLFSDDTSDRIIFFDNKEGYIIETNNGKTKKYIDFAKIGCNGVYFDQCKNDSITFASNGAPKNDTAGSYTLRHHENSDFACVLTIQVSSGRVDLSEV